MYLWQPNGAKYKQIISLDFSLSYTFQFQLKWVRLDQITANFLMITIYSIRDRSHDQTNKIFELSLKNGVRLIYNITRSYSLLPHSHFGRTLPRSKLWMNQWTKSLSSGMIKNESYFIRTRNYYWIFADIWHYMFIDYKNIRTHNCQNWPSPPSLLKNQNLLCRAQRQSVFRLTNQRR